MSNSCEMFALVEMTGGKPHPAMNALAEPSAAPTIKRVIRSYEGKVRAEEDLELLRDVDEFKSYAVLTIPHIDR